MTSKQEFEQWVYIGTYTRREPDVGPKSEGIYLCRFESRSGALTYAGVQDGVDNPSFLAIHPNGELLFSVDEIDDFGSESSGAVSAFAIDRESGRLTYLNKRPTQGTGPCHLTVDATGKSVLITNYGSGSVCVLPIEENGQLGAASSFVQHEGSSINPQRQQGPHAHSITLDSGNRHAYVADLGMDKVMIYDFDPDTGTVQTNPEQAWARTKSGAGPRHFAFHTTDKYAYVINEIGSTITVFDSNIEKGTLTEIQTISTLPEGFDERSHCADIHVHPSGKFLYGSNRGHDSIAVYSVDEETGKLTSTGFVSTSGKIPRNFAIAPGGRFLLAANQDTHNIVVFEIDQDTGGLTRTEHEVEIPFPVCIKFLQ